MSRTVRRSPLRSGWEFGRCPVPQIAPTKSVTFGRFQPCVWAFDQSDNDACSSIRPHANSQSYQVGLEYRLKSFSVDPTRFPTESSEPSHIKEWRFTSQGISCFQRRRGISHLQRLDKVICFRQNNRSNTCGYWSYENCGDGGLALTNGSICSRPKVDLSSSACMNTNQI